MPFCRGRRQSIIMRIMSISITMTIAAAAVTMMTTMTAAVGADVGTTMYTAMKRCLTAASSCGLA